MIDLIACAAIAAPVIWIVWTFIRFPLPRGQGPLGLIIDAVVRDSLKRK